MCSRLEKREAGEEEKMGGRLMKREMGLQAWKEKTMVASRQ